MKVFNKSFKPVEAVLNGQHIRIDGRTEAEMPEATWLAVKNLFPSLEEATAKKEVTENAAPVVKNKKSRK